MMSFFEKRKTIRNLSKDVSPGTVAMGYVNAALGGVPHHMQAIQAHSEYKVSVLLNPVNIDKLKKYRLEPLFKEKLHSSVLNNSFKLLHSHVDPWFINLCVRAKENSIPWVHTYHTMYFKEDWAEGLEDWQVKINNSLINEACQADVKFSVSRWLQEHLKQEYNIQTEYIPNGVDVEKCDTADASRFSEKTGLKDFVLFASGISDIKNPLAFIKLAEALPEFQFVIIGRQISIEALMEKYRIELPENLRVIGQMPHEELLDAIAACRVFVVTSRSEGLPTVLMEAMALERTVVGCNTYGTKEVIHSEEYGYIYDHTSLDDLIEKTRSAYVQSRGTEARLRILEHYDWKVVIPKIDKVYTDLIS